MVTIMLVRSVTPFDGEVCLEDRLRTCYTLSTFKKSLQRACAQILFHPIYGLNLAAAEYTIIQMTEMPLMHPGYINHGIIC
jgi:hypothetical protein